MNIIVIKLRKLSTKFIIKNKKLNILFLLKNYRPLDLDGTFACLTFSVFIKNGWMAYQSPNIFLHHRLENELFAWENDASSSSANFYHIRKA